jgi:hypothetical protein
MHGFRVRFWALLVLSLFALAPSLRADWSDENYEVGEVVKVKILDVRPTQFSVGAKEIEFRMVKIQGKEEAGPLGEYKKKSAGKAVIGPNGDLYLVDGHHFARALYDLGKESMWVEVIRDYSDLTPREFWAKLRQKNYCYLRDHNGRLRPVRELPRTIAGLDDDPYRSLAWMVRHAGSYDDMDTPFQEFFWAQYLRRRMGRWPDTYDGWKNALKQAMRLARKSEADHLPGWNGEKGDCAEILKMLDGVEE